jgi:hypothetical protein
MSLSTSGDNALFLSYARADESDGGFVSTLHEKLEAAGYSTWWDQVDMPSRGLAFMHEMLERAVREARQLPATVPRIQALSFAAGALRHAGHPQASELWTETMEALGAWQPGGRDLDAVSSSVHASLLTGCFDHAEPAARLARDPKERSALLTQVALGALDADLFAVSERIAAELE